MQLVFNCDIPVFRILSVLADTIPPLHVCCLPSITTVTWLCAFVLSSGSGMAYSVGTKISRRLETICVVYESVRSVGVLMVYM